MREFVLRWVANGITLAVTAALLPGIHIRDNSLWTLALIALIFGLVNAFLKPVLIILSCPLIILTLGLFFLVVNGLMLLITDALSGGRLTVDGLGWAMLGGLVIALVGSAVESAFGLNKHDQPGSDGNGDDPKIITLDLS